jgi:NAD-dependent DNA ligase
MLNFVPTIEQVLYISNIPSFGKTVCEQYGQISIVDFIEVFINDMTIENWSKYSVNYLNQENLIKASPYVKEILKFFDCKLKEVEKTLAYAQLDWVVAVTGGVCMEREAWFKKLAQWGIKKGSVNKKTKYLVTNEQDNSNKLDKARQLGIEVITENDLYDKMGITEGDILK